MGQWTRPTCNGVAGKLAGAVLQQHPEAGVAADAARQHARARAVPCQHPVAAIAGDVAGLQQRAACATAHARVETWPEMLQPTPYNV